MTLRSPDHHLTATHVVTTAGHVDHGKSALVRALTGTDPDRLAEEKARGLTIDLGFAWCPLDAERAVALIDVPGHVRFLRNMIAGVGAVDACLFVVAATEGWKPQSEEHLRILEGLGHRNGVLALTKAALVDADTLDRVRREVADHVATTFLDEAEMVAVDSVDGTGVAGLRLCLGRLVDSTPVAADRGRPRLWVDRSFTLKGVGTVVTGTLTGGYLSADDTVLVEPQHRSARIRGLQSHGRDEASVAPGQRVAVNLSGVSHHEIGRGDALVHAGQWHAVERFDARLDVLASLDHPVSRRGAHLAYLGSGEYPVRLRVLGPTDIDPGRAGFVRLHLPVALPLLPGDRFVLRDAGRAETIGGGEILDVDPRRPASRARPDRDPDRVVAERGWVDVDELERLTGHRRPADLGRWVVDPAVLAAEQQRWRDEVEAAGDAGVDLTGLTARQRHLVQSLDGVTVAAGRATLGTPKDAWAAHPYLAQLRADPFGPPTPEEAGVARSEVRELVQRGHAVTQAKVCFAVTSVDQACRILADLLDDHPDGITVGDVRRALGTTRKYAVPLLELLDSTGRTRRRGDRRIAGPRLRDAR